MTVYCNMKRSRRERSTLTYRRTPSRFPFSLIALFVSLAFVGVPLAWYANSVWRQRHAVDAVEQAGGEVWYSFETEYVDSHFHRIKDAPLRVPEWVHNSAGIDSYDRPTVVFLLRASSVPSAKLGQLASLRCLVLKESSVDDAGVSQLNGLNNLRELYLDGTDVTDTGIRSLAHLEKLCTLSVRRTQITDEGLMSVGNLENLETLDLGGTNVTDKGLAHLARLRGLVTLDLRSTNVDGSGLCHMRELPLALIDVGDCPLTRAGIDELAKIVTLKAVILPQAGVTDADIAHLRRALPNCQFLRR
jgi:hypothetical protein